MRDQPPEGLLITWYGDDFTGSAAVMEVLTFGGLPSVLFLDTPTVDDLAQFPGVRGIGIASMARTESPDWMEANLPAPFSWMKGTTASICHYKTCSTFDSAPEVGSIGRAADIGARLFRDPAIPMLVAAPPLRRYQAFGHLFAGAGAGVYRLDRHPVMARHPVTPMPESDLARHLAAQTQSRVALISLEDLAQPDGGGKRMDTILSEGPAILSIDTMDEDDLARAGALIWQNRTRGRFVLGSQGVEYALIAYFKRKGWLTPANTSQSLPPVSRLPVVSGSVSPITASQITHAQARGFKLVPLDPTRLLHDAAAGEAEIARVVSAALATLEAGASPLIASAQGPDDPTVEAFKAARLRAGVEEGAANARIGAALGKILATLLDKSGLTRAVVSGGDTSGSVTRRLGIRALTARAATTPGAALFNAHRVAPNQPLELALKGGQMGAENLFSVLRDGTEH